MATVTSERKSKRLAATTPEAFIQGVHDFAEDVEATVKTLRDQGVRVDRVLLQANHEGGTYVTSLTGTIDGRL